ncbi:transposase [Kitasatospora gansuensis]
MFSQHPQSRIYLSFPGVGLLTGARLLSELGDDPTRFATAKGLAAYAGARPFTWASGTSRTVLHRRVAANKRLAAYGHYWAFTSLTKSPQCRAHYDKRRAAATGTTPPCGACSGSCSPPCTTVSSTTSCSTRRRRGHGLPALPDASGGRTGGRAGATPENAPRAASPEAGTVPCPAASPPT